MGRVDTHLTQFRLINKLMADNGDVMTRQVSRQLHRLKAAAEQASITATIRRDRQNERLARQAAREKSGFYDGTMALANVLGQHFGRMRRQAGENGGLVRLR